MLLLSLDSVVDHLWLWPVLGMNWKIVNVTVLYWAQDVLTSTVQMSAWSTIANGKKIMCKLGIFLIPESDVCKNTSIHAILVELWWIMCEVYDLDSRGGDYLCNKLQNIDTIYMPKKRHNVVNHGHILYTKFFLDWPYCCRVVLVLDEILNRWYNIIWWSYIFWFSSIFWIEYAFHPDRCIVFI